MSQKKPGTKNTKASVLSAANDAGDKSYRVVGNAAHWAVSEDDAEPAGDFLPGFATFERHLIKARTDDSRMTAGSARKLVGCVLPPRKLDAHQRQKALQLATKVWWT
jgi:hypothetical protein